ncbi:MAG: GMC family oxidoreductase [Deltaproteobacteria bacterium]|nr:GMC family oxidoreductase [Deltaproteobacteria bacterium]
MAIVDCSTPGQAKDDLRCDVAVVGSGCGGATAARVLAEGGRDVLVLEEGGDYVGPERLTQRDLPMYDQLYADRGSRTNADRTISVLSGRVLGGGGVINACDVVPVHPQTWRYWQNVHGLADWSPEAMAPFVAKALHDLEASPIPESMVNRNNQILREGAGALGLAGEVMHHNRVGCLGLGTCLIGCPAGAKRNPRMVAVPKALEAGARVVVRARVVSIQPGKDGEKTLLVRALDAKGYRETATFRVRCKRVVLAAGPVGTVSILRASGLGGAWLGRGLSLQPQVAVVARMKERVNAFDGIPQSYAVTAFERNDAARGLHGYRIEGIFGTPGILGSLVTQAGIAGKQAMAALPHVAACLVLVPDDPVGQITFPWSGGRRIDYTLADEWKSRAREAVRTAMRCYLAAGATEVLVACAPPIVVRSERELGLLDGLSFAPATIGLISAHQQGGTRVAVRAERGVCAPDGQVWGAAGVYVCDGGVFPSTSSTHTMAPILTVAHALAAGWLSAWRA